MSGRNLEQRVGLSAGQGRDCPHQAEGTWDARHEVSKYKADGGGGLEQLQHTGSKEQECATRRESGVGSQFKVGTVNLC